MARYKILGEHSTKKEAEAWAEAFGAEIIRVPGKAKKPGVFTFETKPHYLIIKR